MNGRRIVRWAVRATGILLVLALAALLVLRISASRRLAAAEQRFEEAVGPVGEDPCASPAVPDEQNAAIYLLAGSEAVVLPGDDKPLAAELTTTPPESWTEGQRKELEHVLGNNAPALALLHRASSMQRSSFGVATAADKLDSKAPLLRLLWGQRLLYLDSLVAIQERDTARLLASTSAMSTMATALEREAPLIVGLVGIGSEKMLLAVVAEAVAWHGLDGRSVAALGDKLVSVDLEKAWKRSLACERHPPSGTRNRQGSPGPRNTLQRIHYALLADLIDAPYVERMAALAGAMGSPYGDSQAGQTTATRPRSDSAILTVTGNLVSAIGRYQTVLSERRLARIALALRKQALESGHYPSSLASFADAAGKDPFTGGQIAYAVRPDGSAELTVPEGVVLWDRLNPEVHNPGPFTWTLAAPGSAPVK